MLLSELARDRGIRYFLISFTDLFGVQRSKLVPAQSIDEMAENGAGFAGFAAWLDMTPADPDILAIPDRDGLFQLPWKPEVAWMPADLCDINGQPMIDTPRLLLKKMVTVAADKGYRIKTGVECEFFLLSGEAHQISDPSDRATKPCYDQQALMRRYDEMNWQYDDVLVTADRHAFFKYMTKSIAEKHGFRATFMPKPFANLTGNGCHTHLSVWDTEGKTNLFTDITGSSELSTLGYQFIGGILESASALCAFTNPSVNSYKRINAPVTLSGATWSPNTISYGGNNRTHTIRIPDLGRFELRLADGAANPYLLPATIIAAGLDGVERKIDPGDRAENNSYDSPSSDSAKLLPANLLDALRCLESNTILTKTLDASFIKSYLKLQYQQWNQYSNHISSWELEHTLDC